MNVFTNYMEKLGSNFLVSSMVPSLALIVASILVFEPIIHTSALFQDEKGVYQLVGFGLLLFIFTVIIGFTLTALNTYILKVFEGYAFFHRIPFMYKLMMSSQSRKAHSLKFQRNILKKRIDDLEHPIEKTPRWERKIKELKRRYHRAAVDYDLNYPQNVDDLLPTQFGNILKASENYPNNRYGFDGVMFYPRLIEVMTPEYKVGIDNSRNELSFLVNMSTLSFAFIFLCLAGIFYTMATPPEGLIGKEVYFYVAGKTIRYLSAGGIAFVLNIFFYKASIYSVSSFGLMIRSAFDLFRMDLMKRLGLKRPKTYSAEFRAWKELNELVVLGRHSLTFTQITYREKE